MTTGAKRRFECSLTKEERREWEITILAYGLNGLFADGNEEYGNILDSLVARGLLCKNGMMYHTTKRGKSALGMNK